MFKLPQVFTYILAGILAVFTSAAIAQTNPRLKHHELVRPIPGGWVATNGDITFGQVSFDFNPGRNILHGVWPSWKNGQPFWYVFGGDLRVNTTAESVSTGVVAYADLQVAQVLGRSDFGTPSPIAGAQSPAGFTARLEFTSTRAGVFVYAPGTPQEVRTPVVSYLQGMPLIAPTNYEGEWMVMSRSDTSSTHQQAMARVRLVPVVLPTQRRVVFNGAMVPTAYGKALPEDESRLYRMVCNGGTSQINGLPSPGLSGCDMLGVHLDTCYPFCESGTTAPMIWFNGNEVGGAAVGTVRSSGTELVLYDTGLADMRAFGSAEKVIVRAPNVHGASAIRELVLYKLPTDVWDGP